MKKPTFLDLIFFSGTCKSVSDIPGQLKGQSRIQQDTLCSGRQGSLNFGLQHLNFSR